MNIEDFRIYCLSKTGTEECLPFDENTLVFKVMGKMFALTSLEKEEFTVNLKCDPDKSLELRESYDEVQPGYHMNKKHWNTVAFERSLRDSFLKELIDHSYNLVVKGLTKKVKAELELLKEMG
ncbi:MmcQ/YjbR family DNA-binding protein [Aureispira anguillae]|uniref:MmcQ/YjbR family DNA-binding protein n=1 Tax=Aureispira anguillae TaxID=2864201 RepID=A0A915YDN4_9BACT|nr:MmcQ/YjbR family DNA-binding protein [Aureispira anguillae]BDS11149.1 MmcQ/YjbR family DNA-binding protein [Aureispira anguillae]